MKKNILIFGLISGLIVSAMMVSSVISCSKTGDFEGNMVLGFTVMIIAFSFIFVAVKNYRDKFNNGVVTFGKAFQIGILVTLVASTMYVVSWLIVYYNFVPNFMEQYTAHEIKNIQAEGLSAAETSEKIADMNKMREAYKNPIVVILYTYLEIFPIGLIIALISALILKRKDKSLPADFSTT
jgi:flagellar biosynthesis protein FliQ